MNTKAERAFKEALGRFRSTEGHARHEDLIPPPSPGPNGAGLYMEALGLSPDHFHDPALLEKDVFIDQDPRFKKLEDRPWREWDDEDWKEASSLIREQEPRINLLLKASAADYVAFPLKYSDNWAMLMPHIKRLINASEILSWDALLHLRNRSDAGVWDRTDAILAAGNALSREATIVSQLVRIVILEKGLDVLEAALPSWIPPPAWVPRFQHRLEGKESVLLLRRAFERELSFFITEVEDYIRGAPTIGGQQPEIPYLLRLWTRPKLWEAAARSADRLCRVLSLLDRPAQSMVTGLAEIQEEFKKDRLSMSFSLADLPKPWRIFFILSCRSLMAQEAIRLRMLENSGKQTLREQIQDLPKDPFYERPLSYRQTDSGFSLTITAEAHELKDLLGLDDPLEWNCFR